MCPNDRGRVEGLNGRKSQIKARSVARRDKSEVLLSRRSGSDRHSVTTAANERAAKYFDQKHQNPPEFTVGSKVYVSLKYIATKRPTKKLDHKRYGPYEIIEAISSHAYRIRLPATLKVHNVFHIDMLEPHHENPFGGRVQTPGPIVESPHDDEYEVEEIIDSRIRRRQFAYLIKWKGYSGPEGQDWVPLEDLNNTAEAQEEFHVRFPTKPKPPGWEA